MSTDVAKLSGQREAIDAALAKRGFENLRKLFPQTEKDWLLFAGTGVALLGSVGAVVTHNSNAGANIEAWRNAFFEPIPSNHITDISTVGVQETDCAGVGFQEDFSVGERRDGELVVLDEQGEVVGPLGDGVCPNGVVVRVGYHRLKPGVFGPAWVWSARDENKRWGGSVKHGFTNK